MRENRIFHRVLVSQQVKKFKMQFPKRLSGDSWRALSFIIIQFACLLSFAIMTLQMPSRLEPQDVGLYYEYATQIMNGKTPYQDVKSSRTCCNSPT
jgi:hypothetical protein